MRIEHLLLFPDKDSVMGGVRTWVDNPMARQKKFYVAVLRDTPGIGRTTVVVICTPGFYREYIETKKMILSA